MKANKYAVILALTIATMISGCAHSPFTHSVITANSLTEDQLPRLQFYNSMPVSITRYENTTAPEERAQIVNNELKLKSVNHIDEVNIPRMTEGQFYRWDKDEQGRINALYVAFEVAGEGFKFTLKTDGKYYLQAERKITREEFYNNKPIYAGSNSYGTNVFNYRGQEYFGKPANEVCYLLFDKKNLTKFTKDTTTLRGLKAK